MIGIESSGHATYPINHDIAAIISTSAARIWLIWCGDSPVSMQVLTDPINFLFMLTLSAKWFIYASVH